VSKFAEPAGNSNFMKSPPAPILAQVRGTCYEYAICTSILCVELQTTYPKSEVIAVSLSSMTHTHIIYATTYNLWCLYTRAVCSTSSSQNRERNLPRHVFGGPSLSSCYAIDVFCEPGQGEARAETSSAKMAGVDT
jgi:hypothetical protein